MAHGLRLETLYCYWEVFRVTHVQLTMPAHLTWGTLQMVALSAQFRLCDTMLYDLDVTAQTTMTANSLAVVRPQGDKER